ncbi:MYPT1 phosphatase, partial [Polypterus senegalus]
MTVTSPVISRGYANVSRLSALWDSGSIKYILPQKKDKLKAGRGMKMADAKQKRNEQLKRWLGSETDLEPPVLKKKKTKVKFDDGAVFLAACSSGDTDEVLKLLDRGADINYANVDGLTALHQVFASLLLFMLWSCCCVVFIFPIGNRCCVLELVASERKVVMGE